MKNQTYHLYSESVGHTFGRRIEDSFVCFANSKNAGSVKFLKSLFVHLCAGPAKITVTALLCLNRIHVLKYTLL